LTYSGIRHFYSGAKAIRNVTGNSLVVSSGLRVPAAAAAAAASRVAEAERSIASIVWQHRVTVVVMLMLSLVGAAVYLKLAPRFYTSTSELTIEQVGPTVLGDAIHESERSDNYLNTQCQVIDSRSILSLALAQDEMSGLAMLRGVDDPIDFIQKNLSVEVGKKTDIINVSMDARDPVEAAKLVNAVVKAYASYEAKSQHSTSAEVLQILQKQKDQDENDLAAKTAQMTNLRKQYADAAFTNEQDNPIIQQAKALSDALSAARLETLKDKAAYDEAAAIIGNDPETNEQIEQPDTAADLAAADETQLALAKGEIFRLEQSLKDLQRTYLPGHPMIAQARSRLNQMAAVYVRAVGRRWQTAKAQEDALQATFDQQYKAAVEQAAQAADFARLVTEVNRIDRDLDVVEGRIKEVSLNEDAGALNISILEAAMPADKPSHPNKPRTWIGAVVLGLLLGGGLSVAKEKKLLVETSHEPVGQTGMPVLGVMPAMDGIATSTTRALQTHLDPVGMVAEASRSIARAVQLRSSEQATDRPGRGRSLLITSVDPLEGRTTLASNLSLAMAQSGLRVLLVDANCRAPRLHQIYKIDNGYGLYDVLAGQIGRNPAICPTVIDGVDLLPSGAAPVNAVEVLNTDSLADVLGELTDRYDQVIIDSPSLGRGVEARLLAASCDGCLLVASARPSARDHLERGKQLLQSVGAKVLGVVINEPGSGSPSRTFAADSQGLHNALPDKATAGKRGRELKPVTLSAGSEI
jgi:capsular exopolysaccharide synthesis family protein